MSIEALLKRKKITEVVTGVLTGMLMMLLVMVIFLCQKKGLSAGLPFLAICLSLSPMVMINVADVRAVKKELQTRS